MYAIVKTGGKQYTVKPGDVFDVEKLPGEAGDTVALPVLFYSDGSGIVTDADALAKIKVEAQIVDQHKGKKQIVFKFKKRKGYKRTKGHRQRLTRICITNLNGTVAQAPKVQAPKEEEPAQQAPKAAVSQAEPAKAEAPKAEAPKTEAPKAAPAQDAAPEQDLSSMTVAQLKELAKERDIKVPSGARKAEIIEIIENA